MLRASCDSPSGRIEKLAAAPFQKGMEAETLGSNGSHCVHRGGGCARGFLNRGLLLRVTMAGAAGLNSTIIGGRQTLLSLIELLEWSQSTSAFQGSFITYGQAYSHLQA